MNGAWHAVAVSVFLTGAVLVAVSALAALRMRRAVDRLHLLAPMTTLGAPLVAIGLVIDRGWSLPSAEICLTCVLLAVTGPVMSSAAARVASAREGSIPQEEPE